MIIINKTIDMFSPSMITLSWKFEGERNYRGNYPVTENQYDRAIAKINVIALKTFTRELFNGRRNNFNRGESRITGDRLAAVSKLEYKITTMSSMTDLTVLAHYIQDSIIPLLLFIKPGKQSRFVNFTPKVESMNKHIDKLLNNTHIQTPIHTQRPTDYA